MVERRDGNGWAVPGGAVEPGETGREAAVRELAEETRLAVLLPAGCQVLPARYVPDPRASDEAWAVTVPVRIGLGAQAGLPFVAAGDDARRAEWVRADSYASLTATLGERFGGRVFAAHHGMLAEILGGAVATRTAALADGSAVLSAADLTLVLGALDCAEDRMRDRACEPCPDCDAAPAGMCGEHADDFDLADAWQAVMTRLGAEVGSAAEAARLAACVAGDGAAEVVAALDAALNAVDRLTEIRAVVDGLGALDDRQAALERIARLAGAGGAG
jgi:ADP-ribose pyrophosphatase YjhB (NUDIX family)